MALFAGQLADALLAACREIGCVPGVMKGADGSAKWWVFGSSLPCSPP
jgi:hypothetical protein